MDKAISRRDFIVGGGVFGASMAAVGLAGCAPSNGGLPSTDTDASGTSAHKGADRLFLRGLSKWMKGMWFARRSAMS